MAANETLNHEVLGLQARWAVCKPAPANPPEPNVENVESQLALAADESLANAQRWQALNSAEQLIAQYLTEAQLAVDFASLLDTAKARALPSLPVHSANEPLFTAGSAAAITDKRAAYVALVHDLQSAFVNGRLIRKLSRDASETLFHFGLRSLLIAVVLFSLLGLKSGPLHESPIYLLALVAAFGCTGACFSQLIGFTAQAKARSLTYDNYLSSYVQGMLALRLLVGVVGAIAFYFVLRSGIVSGSAFPVMIGPDKTKLLGGDGIVPLKPDLNLACMLVWSFVAGFSERLVPDTLGRIESKASKDS